MRYFQFRTKSGDSVLEYCVQGSREQCQKRSLDGLVCSKVGFSLVTITLCKFQWACIYDWALQVHFRQLILPHTDMGMGDWYGYMCYLSNGLLKLNWKKNNVHWMFVYSSYLDACRHMKTCRFLHYEIHPQDLERLKMAKIQRAHFQHLVRTEAYT